MITQKRIKMWSEKSQNKLRVNKNAALRVHRKYIKDALIETNHHRVDLMRDTSARF